MASIKNAGIKRMREYQDWLKCAPVPQDIYDNLRDIAGRFDPLQADIVHDGYLSGLYGKKFAADLYCELISQHTEENAPKVRIL